MKLQSFLGIFFLVLATSEPSWGISRSQVISNAQTWFNRGVPYSQEKYEDGYRTDCSGYVSMAWATGTSYTTGSLGRNSVSTSISPVNLKAGDILLKTGRGAHVVIFHQWEDDSTKAECWIYEQAGGSGTLHRKVTYPYSTRSRGVDYGYYPRQYNSIED